ncbi:pyridoxal-dependent decarboxylase, exosortase A system-associated [Amycolatopsis sp. CA-128772]|uniref:pyridoxal-dependent decarboxylase, exosortase A system-associated n=1 Tax=Amycolatopsis sp. CA-128772 TaxID=2073159 RepID=UPI000CD0B1DB|nr:pyridoxal-dependent decarboxylase, exosortase A system-associated [Amycolatopsis sp. CA-128772]
MANTTEAAAAPHRRAGGVLTVGGVPVDRLAARVGTTPFFAYDRSLVTTRVERVRAALPDGVELSYAVKANPMPALLHHLSGLVDGLDVASAGELRQALDTTVPPGRISFAGPGKTAAELARAVAAGVTVELESTTELARVREAGDRLGLTPRVALRVNPDFAVRGSGMRLGGGPQQFGIDAERVPAVLAEVGAAGLDFQGFHVFAGSQNLRAESLCEAQRATVDLVLQLAESAPGPVRSVNLGGGFGIPYTARDTALDLDEVGENLAKLLDVSLRPALPEARVVIELGRYLVGEAGVYLTRVVDRKVSRGTTFLVVDGGLHHQLAASGNFGQAIRRNYPLELASAPGGPEETVTVVGCLCTPLDLLGDRVSLPGAAIGDLIAIFQAGAYGLTASPTAFLGHPAPPEVLV